MWSSTQIPHIVQVRAGRHHRRAGVEDPRDRARRGRRLRRQARGHARGVDHASRSRGGSASRSSTPRRAARACRAAHHGRDQVQKITLAAEKDGTVTGLKVHLVADLGSYVALLGGGIPLLGAFMFNAIYKFPAYQFNCQTVFTNRTWTDAYRGAGRPEATFAIERVMDDLAAHLGVDPLEIREKNWIKNDEFPFDTVAGLQYDTGNYEAATAKAKEVFGYDALRAEQKERRERGDKVQLGIGVSTYTEMCGLAPSRILGQLSYGAGGWEHAEHPDARDRQGRGGHRHEPARAGPRDGVQPDRGRPARRTVRGRRGPARRHPGRRPGPGHLRLAVARARRRGGRQGRRQGGREGQARSRRT